MTSRCSLTGLLAFLLKRHVVTYECIQCRRTRKVRFRSAEEAQAAAESRRPRGRCDCSLVNAEFWPAWQLDPQVRAREEREQIETENNWAWLPGRSLDGYRTDNYCRFQVALVRDFPPINGKRRLRVYRVVAEDAFYPKDSLVCCRLTQEGDYHQRASGPSWFDIFGSETSKTGPRVGGIEELEYAGEETLEVLNSLTGSQWLPGKVYVKALGDRGDAEGHIYRWCDDSHAIVRVLDRSNPAKTGPLFLCREKSPWSWVALSEFRSEE